MENYQKKITTTTTQEEMPTTPQRTLFGAPKPIIKDEFKLSENQFNMMAILYLNTKAFSQTEISKLANVKGINCAGRFIKRAISNGWVRELKVIPGATINNLFMFYKEPDKLENGQLIKDNRNKYYVITDFGKKVFEANEKLLK